MVENKELRDLATHAAGAVDLHETRETDEPVRIDPAGAPGPMKDEEKRTE